MIDEGDRLMNKSKATVSKRVRLAKTDLAKKVGGEIASKGGKAAHE